MRAAVIGANWGGVHVAALREAGVDVIALCGRDPRRTRAAADELGIRHALTDPAHVAELGVDLVSVATPAATHVQVISTLPGDVPVLCEKPAVGLSGAGDLPERSAPVWVNYAFAFLEVAQRAASAVDELGPVRSARVRSTHDLAGSAFTPEQMFFELVPHPWSWLAALLGPVRSGRPVATQAHEVAAAAVCGDVPVEIACAPDPGLGGLRHEVVVEAAGGRVRLRGTYLVGLPWLFEAPSVEATSGERRILGDPEAGPGDPWYRANARSIGAVVAAVRDGTVEPRLFDWPAALAMDLAAREGLARRESHGA